MRHCGTIPPLRSSWCIALHVEGIPSLRGVWDRSRHLPASADRRASGGSTAGLRLEGSWNAPEGALSHAGCVQTSQGSEIA